MPRTWGTKIGHVRVCGDSGRATARFYPAGPEQIKDYGVNARKAAPLRFF
jgi:hypothetical protein